MQFLTYLKHVRAELSHVVWPDTRTAVAHTLLLIGIGAFTAAFLAVLDYAFTHGVSWLIAHY
jgi:preprotein translocase SecE subunit